MNEFDDDYENIQDFVDFYGLTDGRNHLIEMYNSNCFQLTTFAIVKSGLPDCLKMHNELKQNGIETILCHLGVFETDEQAANLINSHIDNSLKPIYPDEDFDDLTFCFDNVSSAIAKKVNSQEIVFYDFLAGELLYNNVFRTSQNLNSATMFSKAQVESRRSNFFIVEKQGFFRDLKSTSKFSRTQAQSKRNNFYVVENQGVTQ